MLFPPPESLVRLLVGTPCLLQVAQRSKGEAAQPSEHAEVFW
jgi:hypothetical protein